MFQLPSHANQQQKLQIDHLSYENQLLIQRNKLLAQQNQRLLEELQTYHEKISKNSFIQTNSVIDNFKEVFEPICQSFHCLDKKLAKQLNKRMLSSFRLNSQEKDSLDMRTLFKQLANIIETLTEGYRSLKSKKMKDKLLEKQQKLTSRRIAREETDNILHIIKEPQDFSHQTKYLTQQLKHQREFFEKLLKRIKRQSISIRQIQSVVTLFERSNKIRWNLKNQQAQLTLLQRKFQLGWIQPISLEDTIFKIKELSDQLTQIREQIDYGLQNL